MPNNAAAKPVHKGNFNKPSATRGAQLDALGRIKSNLPWLHGNELNRLAINSLLSGAQRAASLAMQDREGVVCFDLAAETRSRIDVQAAGDLLRRTNLHDKEKKRIERRIKMINGYISDAARLFKDGSFVILYSKQSSVEAGGREESGWSKKPRPVPAAASC